jgi:DNA polymerase III epsilon subunit-like protein
VPSEEKGKELSKMKYVSIDIETSGLDPSVHSILEFAAVAADTERPGERETFLALIVPDDMEKIVVGPFTALLHVRLWKALEAFKKRGQSTGINIFDDKSRSGCLYVSELGRAFRKWVIDCFGDTGAAPKITAAGKNVATFDLPFLKAHTNIHKEVVIRHRTLDVTSHFYIPGDECLPDMNNCLLRAGINKQTDHTALGDALNVCDLVDHVFSKKIQQST